MRSCELLYIAFFSMFQKTSTQLDIEVRYVPVGGQDRLRHDTER